MDAPRPDSSQPITAGPVLEHIQQRLLWLAVRMVDHANRERPNPDGGKVGGHQASSTSIVSIMTALYFGHLQRNDLVAVKPHASPVLHAVNYLLGWLDRSYLTRLRELGGLQAYPSRTKDPDPVDFSTGSVGLGPVATLFAAAARRYVAHHHDGVPSSRFVAVMGDAELDEGSVWEALSDPVTEGLGNVLWVVDLNRQSLDRVVPGIKARQLRAMFEANEWQVIDAKYGRRLREAFARPGGGALRRHIDRMPNEQYQSLFTCEGAELRKRFLDGADAGVESVVADESDERLGPLVRDLGGHDLQVLLDAFAEADAVTDRPAVVFAYTIKGWGLPIAGDPHNHSALLSGEQIDALREELGINPADEWAGFGPDTPEGRWCAETARRLEPRPAPNAPATLPVPAELGVPGRRTTSTQEAFGRLMVRLAREEAIADRVVTTSPDVAVSTNLGGWINKAGVYSHQPNAVPFEHGPLRWAESTDGQHVELGISEMNLFMLLGMLGCSGDVNGQPLLPIGTLYDPFIARGLDALTYAVYSGSRFVLVATPSGVTLSSEGGAHQSTVAPSIGVELPQLTFAEPAYAVALDWLLCDALGQLTEPDGESVYLRLSTRSIDQAPFERARQRLGDDRLRQQILEGGYLLRDPHPPADAWTVTLCASGAVMPEVLRAAAELEGEGVAAAVVDITSLDRLHRGWRASRRRSVRRAQGPENDFLLPRILPPAHRRAPMVTVHDAASHAMSWVGSPLGAPVVPLGVDAFGQSGSIHDLYGEHDLLPGCIVNAALTALDVGAGR